uniref:Ubiquitin carboxyl-terminal hydrolase n=1 Tax=Ascaris suum TaxID=6253 RepID=F1KYA2_ASCSU
MPNVTVKWGREKLNLDADLNEIPLVFKSQLFALTGVAPERQKVMIKGKILGDESWNGITLPDGAVIMMMGTTQAPPTAPTARQQFLEDMTEAEATAAVKLPVGIKNLGNTCYMNATLQCFKAIPELKEALGKYSESLEGALSATGADAGSKAITVAVKDLYRMMDNTSARNSASVIPLIMLQVLHHELPQFATRDEHGQWVQQDANECWTELLRAFQTQLKMPAGSEASGTASFVAQYMEGRFKVQMKNLESDAEPVMTSTEKFLQLSCFLSQEVKYVQLGIKSKMTEEIEKNSEILGRNARYEKKALIDRLPAYLSIQMVRFFYKEKDKVNAKILKDVKFPMSLDMYDMCTPELQEKLMPMREAFKADEDKKLEQLRLSKAHEAPPEDGKIASKEEENKVVPFSFEDDPGSNNSGFYELQGVITHKGRSSNSGHYVGWVRIEGDRWAMCDDDDVQPVSSEDVLRLSGGGDWHCAYLLLYGPRILRN